MLTTVFIIIIIIIKAENIIVFIFYLNRLQEAVARGLELEFSRLGQPECYFLELPRELEEKRNKMEKVLKESSFIPIIPEGGYFMMAKYGHLGELTSYTYYAWNAPQGVKIVLTVCA